jgi:hypothetical protein
MSAMLDAVRFPGGSPVCHLHMNDLHTVGAFTADTGVRDSSTEGRNFDSRGADSLERTAPAVDHFDDLGLGQPGRMLELIGQTAGSRLVCDPLPMKSGESTFVESGR